MENPFVVAWVTAPSLEVGQAIAQALVEKKLAACVNLLPAVQSVYRWQGQIQQDQEVLLMVKTRTSIFIEQLLPTVKQLHPYEVPEIIALPIRLGSPDYLNWIAEETQA